MQSFYQTCIETPLDISGSYFPESPTQVKFCATYISVHMWPTVHVHTRGVQLKSKLRHSEIWATTLWPSRHLCYRPAVFFYHVILIVLSFPKRKIRFLSICLNSLKITCLKIRHLKLGKAGSVCNYPRQSWTNKSLFLLR
jgi:hypothetical protein